VEIDRVLLAQFATSHQLFSVQVLAGRW